MKYIVTITDEGIDRTCYKGGGWDFTPYGYAISSTDILSDITVLDEGTVTDVALTTLKKMNKSLYLGDSNIWYSNQFSFITKCNDVSLIHKIVVPSNASQEDKIIKTVYFLYKNTHISEEPFLYAVAYAVNDIEYKANTLYSDFFTFTLTTAHKKADKMYLDYSFPEFIYEHNTQLTDETHIDLLATDGSRKMSGILNYSKTRTFETYDLVDKEYVDSVIAVLKSNNNLR